jgi:hypothetical protein
MDGSSSGGGNGYRVEAERWLSISEKLLAARDLHGAKSFAIRSRDSINSPTKSSPLPTLFLPESYASRTTTTMITIRFSNLVGLLRISNSLRISIGNSPYCSIRRVIGCSLLIRRWSLCRRLGSFFPILLRRQCMIMSCNRASSVSL